ncbi:AraC family transcriptional regulator [Rhodophyticola sp. CCM32]|uniref:AraC family transcriptional regulator n=1 Tax=Rhodophyticola sp. CCM32 TaxID=2916397 RepID=UPI00107F1887|nr:AraC family transcriptional regulator [Rhodophyticola sp. CCM32]QBY00489.1 AraC family transcriptional regulator [Rhodophyticola sp. CCM32]
MTRPKRTDMQITRYPVAHSLQHSCNILTLTPARVLRRAGLPTDLIENEGRGVTAEQYIALIEALYAEAPTPDTPIMLGKALARGPFVPAIFAFSCSPNIEIGLSRLALFKPLVAPVRLEVRRSDLGVELSFASRVADMPLPGSFAAFELVYFIECCRNFTAHPVVPLQLCMPQSLGDHSSLETYLGQEIEIGPMTKIVLSVEDAERPLISANEALWARFESDLTRQMESRSTRQPVSTRVRHALLEMLPGGQPTADAVCQHLHVSKRTLQRRLKSEGQSFQNILDDTRKNLALHYLRQEGLRVEEISYLLAYRDPNSFYRAFNDWTGMTPAEARARA